MTSSPQQAEWVLGLWETQAVRVGVSSYSQCSLGPAMPFFPTDLTDHGRAYGRFGDCCGEQRGTVLVGYYLLQCLLEGARPLIVLRHTLGT